MTAQAQTINLYEANHAAAGSGWNSLYKAGGAAALLTVLFFPMQILVFLIIYKLDTNLTIAMTTPFMMGLGFSKTDIGLVVKGFGTVATGTLISGSVTKEQDVELYPAGRRLRVRGVQVHGRAAEQNRQPCAMCHETAFCTSCHGLQMPHPSGWVKGPNGHSDFAKTNSKVCVQCHGEGPTMCSMCHHKAYEPGPGPWASNHAPSAKRRGIALCLSCHDPLFCVKCHTSHRSRETTTP